MKIELSPKEVEIVLGSLRMAAHEYNRTANEAYSNGYSAATIAEMRIEVRDLYLLSEKIESTTRRYRAKPEGSTGTVDPFDNPKVSQRDEAKTPNDPIEW